MQNTNTIHAIADDFKSGLYYRDDLEAAKIGLGPFPALRDIDYIRYSVDALREIFERLQGRGIHIPTAYCVTGEYEEDGPRESWDEILRDMKHGCHLLSCLVNAMLDEDTRDMDSVCCGWRRGRAER
jgi:hypothetical protein